MSRRANKMILPLLVSKIIGGGSFNPAALSPWGWWNATDLSNVFQDVAGTTPIVSGQPTALIKNRGTAGTAADMTQATSSLRPQWLNTGLTPGIVSDEVDDYLTLPNTNNAVAAMTIFALVYPTAITTNPTTAYIAHTILGSGFAGNSRDIAVGFQLNGANGQLNVYSESDSAAFRSQLSLGVVASVINNWYVISCVMNGTSSKTRVNGVTLGTATMSDLMDTRRLTLANEPVYGSVFAPFKGKIAETVLLTRAPSDAEISKMERYLGAKVGLSL